MRTEDDEKIEAALRIAVEVEPVETNAGGRLPLWEVNPVDAALRIARQCAAKRGAISNDE